MGKYLSPARSPHLSRRSPSTAGRVPQTGLAPCCAAASCSSPRWFQHRSAARRGPASRRTAAPARSPKLGGARGASAVLWKWSAKTVAFSSSDVASELSASHILAGAVRVLTTRHSPERRAHQESIPGGLRAAAAHEATKESRTVGTRRSNIVLPGSLWCLIHGTVNYPS